MVSSVCSPHAGRALPLERTKGSKVRQRSASPTQSPLCSSPLGGGYPPAPLCRLLREKSRLLRLLGCKRPPDASAALPTFPGRWLFPFYKEKRTAAFASPPGTLGKMAQGVCSTPWSIFCRLTHGGGIPSLLPTTASTDTAALLIPEFRCRPRRRKVRYAPVPCTGTIRPLPCVCSSGKSHACSGCSVVNALPTPPLR